MEHYGENDRKFSRLSRPFAQLGNSTLICLDGQLATPSPEGTSESDRSELLSERKTGIVVARRTIRGVVQFFSMSDDEIVQVLSHLWFYDLYRMSFLNRRFRRLVLGNSILTEALFSNLVKRNGTWGFNGNHFCKSLTGQQVLVLASRTVLWPTDIDTSDLRYGLIEVAVENQTSKCVAYSGSVLGKNRAFVANHHFPIFGFECEDGLETISEFPFAKPVFDRNTQSTISVLSGIAYFEIKIHKSMRHVLESAVTPCLAIGIANHRHRLYKMPGWNDNSYGYHGDDGRFFHRYKDEGTFVCSAAKFGEEDIVGFGIIYPQLKNGGGTSPIVNEIFLTVNGKLVDRYSNSLAAFHQCPWFPCVGTDGHCPVEMNFGNKGVAFQFDVIKFEQNEINQAKFKQSTKATVLNCLQLDKRATMATYPTVPFREPYHQYQWFEGGQFLDKNFWSQTKAHLDGNSNVFYEEC